MVSGSGDILRSARNRLPYLRRIYDASSATAFNGKTIASTANESDSMAIIFGAQTITRENVEYLQKRMKAVWRWLEDKDEFATFKGIVGGAL